MEIEFKHLIQIAGTALEAEDRYIREAIAANPIAYPNGRDGILRINNERYYQFIVARALVSSFPFAVTVEVGSHDLVLRYPHSPEKWFAVVEMKRWMSVEGEQEISAILRDINEKLRPAAADHALMVLFSANPRGTTKTQLGWLTNRLNIAATVDPDVWECYSFPTLDSQGKDVEFWVAGYEVK
jgi:hypothetical protein